MESITITGRRWFQKSYGNTYCTAEIWVDDKHIVKTEPQYGYDDHFKTIAMDELVKLGIITDREGYSNGSHEAIRFYCERKGIALHVNCYDVRREKDL